MKTKFYKGKKILTAKGILEILKNGRRRRYSSKWIKAVSEAIQCAGVMYMTGVMIKTVFRNKNILKFMFS